MIARVEGLWLAPAKKKGWLKMVEVIALTVLALAFVALAALYAVVDSFGRSSRSERELNMARVAEVSRLLRGAAYALNRKVVIDV